MSTAITPRSASAPRKRGRRPGLSREQIAGVALRLIDDDGLDALTMPRLASELGVGTMTLYGYFRSKDELLDAVVDAITDQGERIRHSASWRTELHSFVMAVYRTLVRHPALVEIRLRKPIVRPQSLRFGETGLSLLVRAGLTPNEAASAFRLLFTYVFGFAALSPERFATDARQQTRTAISSLPPDKYPNLTTHADVFSRAMAGANQFDYGLNRILDSIEQAASRRDSRKERSN